MTVFAEYAAVYDAAYADKSYEQESAYVLGLIRGAAPAAQRVLDLGCGTGRHAVELAKAGMAVTGVDRSIEMLARARERASTSSEGTSFEEGDVRTVRLDRTFDAVVSLFHVINYQTTPPDLAAMIATARCHLRSGGVFLFDFWFGPAVLANLPAVRVKRFIADGREVVRIAEPVLDPERNVVRVAYTLFVAEPDGSFQRIEETHSMRYLFPLELDEALRAGGFRTVSCHEWLTARRPDLGSWSATYVAVADGPD